MVSSRMYRNARFVYGEKSKLVERPRYPEQPKRVRYGVAAGKTLRVARMAAHWLVWPGNIFGLAEWPTEGNHWLPRQAAVGADEHRNEVIAAKCTVTALPFAQSVYHARLSAFGETTHLPGYREDDSREWDCSRERRGARRLIERPTMARRLLSRSRGRTHGKHLHTLHYGQRSRNAAQREEPVCPRAGTSRRAFRLSAGRNETQIGRKMTFFQRESAANRDKNLDSPSTGTVDFQMFGIH